MSVRLGPLTALRIGGAVAAVVVFACSAIPDDREESKVGDSEERSETARLIQAELPRWNVAMGERAADLKLNANSVLRWTNPATGRIHGEIYLWTADGRPEAVMSLYKGWEPALGFLWRIAVAVADESRGPSRPGRRLEIRQAGIALHDVPDAPAVAETAQRRLQHMRAMAKDFSAVMIDYRNNRGGERQSLRLLTAAHVPVFEPQATRLSTGPCSGSCSAQMPRCCSCSKLAARNPRPVGSMLWRGSTATIWRHLQGSGSLARGPCPV